MAKKATRPAVLAAPAANAMAGRRRRPRYGTQTLLIALAVMWALPLGWTLYTALRPYSSTQQRGYFSVGGSYSLQNFLNAYHQGTFPLYLKNSLLIVVPSLIATLALASLMAFAVSRVSWKGNITLLIMFTAGNLLPPQVLAAPLFEIFKHWANATSSSGTMLDTYWAVIIAETAFQTGFCTFVLSNYMRALPGDLTEAARVDGASLWSQFWRIILPLCRPALAALGTLEIIILYNDFFWPLILLQTGSKLPVTTAIQNLNGQFFTNYNLLAAGAVITLIPTLVIYVLLQRQFVAGLTLGASKG